MTRWLGTDRSRGQMGQGDGDRWDIGARWEWGPPMGKPDERLDWEQGPDGGRGGVRLGAGDQMVDLSGTLSPIWYPMISIWGSHTRIWYPIPLSGTRGSRIGVPLY